MSILLVILDGLGDLPVKELGNKTPLEIANAPNMDKLAGEGITGLHRPLGNKKPESDDAHLAIFGYDLNKHYLGRGPYEAAGIGMEMKKGDVALRVNGGTVNKDLIVKDRRAGRVKNMKPFVEPFNMELEGIKFLLKPGTEHRAVLLMRGKGLSPKITGNDPHKEKVKLKEVEEIEPEGGKTAHLLNEFLKITHEKLTKMKINKKRKEQGKLPVNYFLCRGSGQYRPVPSMKKIHGLKSACVAGAGLYKGVAKTVGMDLLDSKLNGTKNEHIESGINVAIDALENYDFVFLHIKTIDLYSHDGDYKGKTRAIEEIDKQFEKLVDLNHTICITGDHATPCSKKDHSSDYVPILIKGKEKDHTKQFSEKICKNGEIGKIEGKDIMPLLK